MASKKSQKLQLSEAEAIGKKTIGRKRKGKTQGDALMLTDTEDEDVPLAQALSIKKKKTEDTSKEPPVEADQERGMAEASKEDQVKIVQTKKTPTPKRKKHKARRNLEIIEAEETPEGKAP